MTRHTNTITPLRGIVTLLVAASAVVTPPALGENKGTERARYAAPAESGRLRFTPIDLSNGSRLTLISPSEWSETSKKLIKTVYDTHEEFTQLFYEVPAFSTSVRLMDEDEFFSLTGAPSWTNALFFRGQIIIPLSLKTPIDLDNLNRSVRHEYTHAILSALSGGHLPGWLDEGLAQIFEGSESPGLRDALRAWLTTHDTVPLSLLQGGFTKLDQEMVPAAYAQSLLATRVLLERSSYKALGNYFLMLREGVDREAAFATAFPFTMEEFEVQLRKALKRWASHPEYHPPR